jgi:hypothetical protein
LRLKAFKTGIYFPGPKAGAAGSEAGFLSAGYPGAYLRSRVSLSRASVRTDLGQAMLIL